jgi:hypothetical protein
MKYKHLLLLTILWSGALTAAAQSGSIVGTQRSTRSKSRKLLTATQIIRPNRMLSL